MSRYEIKVPAISLYKRDYQTEEIEGIEVENEAKLVKI